MLKVKSIVSSLLLTLAVTITASAHAAEVSDVPVFALSGVEPNVLMALDNSSSMDDERLVINHSEKKIEDAFKARRKRIYFDDKIFTDAPAIAGVATLRSSEFNATYYDPNVTYKPWPTFGSYTTVFPNANPNNAAWTPINGIYPWTRPNLDLTSSAYFDFDRSWRGWVCDDNGNVIEERGSGKNKNLWCGNKRLTPRSGGKWRLTYPYRWAHYFVKNGECGDESTWYPSPSCLTRVEISDAAGLQNYANWFTYYRDRLLLLKGALGEALKEQQTKKFRAGMFPTSINGRLWRYDEDDKRWRQRNDQVSFTKDKFSSHPEAFSFQSFEDRKGDFLRKLYEMPRKGGTPLRDALYTSGEIYSQTGNNKVIEHACQANYTILFTDGYEFDQRIGPRVSNPNYLEDKRMETGEVIGAAIRVADNNAEAPFKGSTNFTLADIAYYYYENLSDRLKGDFPLNSQKVIVPTECDTDNPPGYLDCNDKLHMTTFTIGMGAEGSIYDPNDPNKDSVTDVFKAGRSVNWASESYADYSGKDKVDDLLHAAVNGRGEVANANNPTQLKKAFSDILEKVLKGDIANSGVDASDEGVDADDPKARYVYRGKMNLASSSGDVEALLVKSSATSTADAELKWSAAKLLNERDLATNPRNVITYSSNQGVYFDYDNLSSTQRLDLQTAPAGESTTSVNDAKDRIAYLKGDKTHDGGKFRDRVSLMGAVASSTPIFNGKPTLQIPDNNPFGTATARYSSFKQAKENRTGVVYAGANDGMLHAFNGNTGEEVFAYIPNLVYSNAANRGLHYLTDKGMTLTSYVDLPSTIYDAYLGNEWKSVLVGGLRTGGPGIFVLDVTDPVKLFSEATTDALKAAAAQKLVIGEYKDPGMGIMLQKPYVAMMNNGKWAAIFSSGYSGTSTELAGQLYIVYLDKGTATDFTAIKIPTGENYGLSPATLGDVDGNGTVDKVYAGDLKGNMWAFDLTSTSDGLWTKYKMFQPSTTQPVTSAPAITANPYMDKNTDGSFPILVTWGTGKYLAESDIQDNSVQSFYVIADNGSTRIRTNLQQQTFTSKGANRRGITGTPPNWTTTFGWYVDLPAGERVFLRPDIFGENVAFFSSKPSTDVCESGGDSWFTTLKLNGQRVAPNPYINLPEFDGDIASRRIENRIIVGGQPIIIGDNRVNVGIGNDLSQFIAVQPVGSTGQAKRTGWEELIND